MCSIPFLINEKGIKTLGNAKSESWLETNKVKYIQKWKNHKFTFITHFTLLIMASPSLQMTMIQVQVFSLGPTGLELVGAID